MNRLSPAHKKRMAPLVDLYSAMVKHVNGLSDDNLAKLDLAARSHGQFNCWFRAYDAAKITLDIISDERAERRRAALDQPS